MRRHRVGRRNTLSRRGPSVRGWVVLFVGLLVRHPDQLRARPPEVQSGATVQSGPNLNDVRAITVTLPDLSQLFDRCLAAGPELTFAVVNGISNNRYLRMDLEETRRLVGYDPQDDGFADWSQR